MVALTVVLGACTSSSGQRPGARSTVSSQQRPAVPRRRDYWPTSGWRTAAPKAEGMDPTVLAAIAGNVARHFPQRGPAACPGHPGAAADHDLGVGRRRLSLGGDRRISQRKGANRDWVGHILGRRLASDPGASFAYSSATSYLLSAIVADATGVSTLAFARARLLGPLGIPSRQRAQPGRCRPPVRGRAPGRMRKPRWPGPPNPPGLPARLQRPAAAKP